jgi:hypothetical protein
MSWRGMVVDSSGLVPSMFALFMNTSLPNERLKFVLGGDRLKSEVFCQTFWRMCLMTSGEHLLRLLLLCRVKRLCAGSDRFTVA